MRLIHFFYFCYKDQKISTTDAKDTSLSTVYDILSSMVIVTLAQNANDSLCHA